MTHRQTRLGAVITRCCANFLQEDQSYVNEDSYVCPPTTIHQNTHTSLKTNHPHNARLGDNASFRSEQTECVLQFFFQHRVVKMGLEKQRWAGVLYNVREVPLPKRPCNGFTRNPLSPTASER